MVYYSLKFTRLKIYYQNVRGIRTKLKDVYCQIACCDYDVIVFTETWLLNGIYDSEITDDRYVLYRRDRSKRIFNSKDSGGGVLIGISRKYKSYRVLDYESSCDDLWVKLLLPSCNGIQEISICGVYLPSPIKVNILDHFISNANRVLEEVAECLILGDFNINTINWIYNNDSIVNSRLCANSKVEQSLWDFITLNDLRQHNDLLNHNKRILDLVLSNMDNINISKPSHVLSKIDLHHPPVQVSLTFSKKVVNIPITTHTKLNYFKADYNSICTALQEIEWHWEFSSCVSVDAMVEKFYYIIRELIHKHVPRKIVKNNKYPYWFSKQLIKRLNEKNRLRLRVKKYNNPMDMISLNLLKKRCSRMSVACFNSYTASLENKIVTNPKLFWSYIKQKRGGSSNYPRAMSNGVEVSENIETISDYFASHFSSVYDNSFNIVPSTHPGSVDRQNITPLNTVTLTETQIKEVLHKLNINKGAGPDLIPPIFVCKTANEISLPLMLIYNKSLQAGVFPSVWKDSNIVPVFKCNDKSIVSNYRPIAILSVLAKVFEALICPILSWHLKQYLSNNQHGFMKGRSTASNLVSYVESLVGAVDSRVQVDAVYTDFSKAFDTVNHSILLEKLQLYGVTGPLLGWFASYLTDREMKVVLNGICSSPYAASSGIPQGSHLGPYLFTLFMNDIEQCFQNSEAHLFADDLKAIKMIRNQEDILLFQSDLDRLADWCDQNKMSLNIKKCKHIRFTRNRGIVNSRYSIYNELLEEVHVIKDLGIQMDPKLKFDLHINDCVLKASKMLGFVLRESGNFKKPATKIILYNSLVRSHLEYCSVVWSPSYRIHIDRIEKVQKRFLWHLTRSCNMTRTLKSYEERLSHFKIPSLETRRKIIDLLFLKKLVTGFLDCPDLLSRINFNVPHRLPISCNSKLFLAPQGRTNLRSHCSLTRMFALYKEYQSRIDLFSTSMAVIKKVVIGD
ncbi:unnamed protein product [Parnassius mnemosyne]|uniref:Reverse transcriptase domain-containing protein n=1 Tax=Parnassius mnemosyne TaxID=213953 RepID=A0AAV1KSV3_9NEOP